MTIKLLAIGKTDNRELGALIATYEKRLSHYIRFEMEVIPALKNTKSISETIQKEREGEAILKKIVPTDTVILLDERGKQYTSISFAGYLQKQMNSGIRQLVLVTGGPYGFSKAVYESGAEQVALSKMTFSHQMVRLFVVEQLYRAFTILRNEPYHHQ